MAEIKVRSAGEAGWAYDVGGKTYYTENEAKRAAQYLDQQSAEQTTQEQDTGSTRWNMPEEVQRPQDLSNVGVIQRNSDGSATLNFAGGGQHTVRGANAAELLQKTYGIDKIINSGISGTEQKALRDNQFSAYEKYRSEANAVEKLNTIDAIYDSAANVSFTDQQVQKIINSIGVPSRSVNSQANRSAIQKAMIGTAMGLSFDEITQTGANSPYNQMLSSFYKSGDAWTKGVAQLTTEELKTEVGRYVALKDLFFTMGQPERDTRNWGAILTSGDAFKAMQVATNQMFGGTTIQYTNAFDENGEPLEKRPYFVSGSGELITSPSYSNPIDMYVKFRSLGIRDISSITAEFNNQFANMEVNTADDRRIKGFVDNINLLNKDSYNTYWDGYENFWENTYATLAPEYKAPIVKPETPTTTTTGTTATTTPQIEEPTPPGGTPPVGDQTYPQYTPPQGLGGGDQYTGAGSTVGGYQGATQESIQAGQQMYGTLPFQYTPTSTYTVGAGGVTGQTQQQQPKQYTVRQFRNASGLSTSITFVDGKPTTPIPSGFYPVEGQPMGMGVQSAMVQAPTFAETPMPQATQQAATGQAQVAPIPASSQIVPFEAQQQQAQQTMGTPSGYMPNFTGQPVTYQMATGGSVPAQTTATSTQPVGEFAGFRPEALQRIANTVGYQGDMNGFNAYLQNNPAANEQMTYFMNAARKMAKGGLLKAQDGVDTTGAVAAGNATKVMPTVLNQQYIPQQNFPTGANLPQVQAEIAKTPGLPTGATVVPVGTTLEAGQLVSPYSGQVSGSVALPTAQAATTAAAMPTQQQATLTSAIEATPAVNGALQSLQAAQGTIDPRAQVLAAQQTASSVGDLQAAQGNAILMDNPIQRQIQDGELISGVANAETASAYTEQLQAAQATPSEQATVQGQLEGLMAQFEGGNTPAWAAGSMRKAMSTLAARGLGASSMAGQAVIQAAMEAALPIAQIDAATQSQFEQMNLSNRQQRVMLAAQQRAAFLGIEFDQAFQARVANAAKISDIANTNFTTEVQIALENSRIANTMNLQNLNNNQALVMAEAAALSQLDMQNLNNRQQAAVQNAQNFLTMDMANLSNQQQTDLFKAQQRVQSLFTDQAAQNAAQQFNASSENQVNQFFANLAQQTAQFNATQANAQAQFNAGQINTIERFNAEINNQRDQFNAQNRLIIDQSNAQWRREIATADSAAVNRANELNATALIGLSQSAYNNLWQYYRDNMEWAWTSAENERQRITNIAIAQLQADSSKSIQEMKQDYQSSANMGAAVFKVLTSDLSNSILGNLFG